MKGRGKGSQFERSICRQLSRWWAEDDEVDDLYWRTSQSGGRATTRAKKGKKTRAHCGDICAVSEEGRELTDLITFELKNGYGSCTIHDLLDRTALMASQGWEKFIDQAEDAASRAGTPYACVIHHRPRRHTIISVQDTLWSALELGTPQTYVRLINDHIKIKLRLVRLDWFLSNVKRADILHLHMRFKK